jgi:hypothetical protein
MKTNIIKGFLALFVLLSIASCKKGENDPALSLRSRTARLTGEWKVSSSTFTSTNSNGLASSTNTSSYDGVVENFTFYVAGQPVVGTINYAYDMTFNKDGSFLITTTYDNGFIETVAGSWAFMGKNKAAEIKNKELVVLSNKVITEKSGNNNYTEMYKGTFMTSDYLILDRLSNNEIIITIDETNNSTSTGNTNSSSRKGTLTLTKK